MALVQLTLIRLFKNLSSFTKHIHVPSFRDTYYNPLRSQLFNRECSFNWATENYVIQLASTLKWRGMCLGVSERDDADHGPLTQFFSCRYMYVCGFTVFHVYQSLQITA